MVMGRNECGSNAMATVQMTVEEYLEMKSRQETKSRLHFCRHPRLDRGSPFPRRNVPVVMPDQIGHLPIRKSPIIKDFKTPLPAAVSFER